METTQSLIKATKSENNYNENCFHRFEAEHTATIPHNKKLQNLVLIQPGSQHQMYKTYRTLTIETSTPLAAEVMHK